MRVYRNNTKYFGGYFSTFEDAHQCLTRLRGALDLIRKHRRGERIHSEPTSSDIAGLCAALVEAHNYIEEIRMVGRGAESIDANN